jgi:Uma2 family endonuclease
MATVISTAETLSPTPAEPLVEYAGLMIGDQPLIAELIAQRQACGGDRYDEVWDGVYYMSPLARIGHQRIIMELGTLFNSLAKAMGGQCYPGANISNLKKNWKQNYRVPDVLVVLPGNPIQNLDTHFVGGPDFLVEVLSPGDQAIEKLPFYAEIGVREVLHVDTDTRTTSLFRLTDTQLQLVGTSTNSDPQVLASAVLPVSFQVVTENQATTLLVKSGDQTWRV